MDREIKDRLDDLTQAVIAMQKEITLVKGDYLKNTTITFYDQGFIYTKSINETVKAILGHLKKIPAQEVNRLVTPNRRGEP